MFNLGNVTLALVDGVDPIGAHKTILHNSSLIRFGAVKLFTFEELPNSSEVTVVKIPKLDYLSYNRFIIFELAKRIDTEFCLLIQTDGFILNPHLWESGFCCFDYVGAPWPREWDTILPAGSSVGNGGFSLRSKRFLECSSLCVGAYDALAAAGHGNEDVFVCRYLFEIMKSFGIKYADYETAMRFSLEVQFPERVRGYHEVFGFHGKFHSPEQLISRSQIRE
jgi:hypothetical protein